MKEVRRGEEGWREERERREWEWWNPLRSWGEASVRERWEWMVRRRKKRSTREREEEKEGRCILGMKQTRLENWKRTEVAAGSEEDLARTRRRCTRSWCDCCGIRTDPDPTSYDSCAMRGRTIAGWRRRLASGMWPRESGFHQRRANRWGIGKQWGGGLGTGWLSCPPTD